MVAMTLIVAAVVVVSLLQSQSGEFGDFSDERTDASSCEFSELEYERALDKEACEETDTAQSIRQSADDAECEWASDNDISNNYC